MRVLAARAPARHLIFRGANSEALQFRKALMLVSFSDAYESLGQTDEALHRSIEARTLLRKISKLRTNRHQTLLRPEIPKGPPQPRPPFDGPRRRMPVWLASRGCPAARSANVPRRP